MTGRRMFITVTHFKGGVGKSTTAVHFAAFLEDGDSLLLQGRPQ